MRKKIQKYKKRGLNEEETMKKVIKMKENKIKKDNEVLF